MGYLPRLVDVSLLLCCSTSKNDAYILRDAIVDDFPSSNHLKGMSGVTKKYGTGEYYIHGTSRIDPKKLGKYTSYLRRFKVPGKSLRFKSVQVELPL